MQAQTDVGQLGLARRSNNTFDKNDVELVYRAAVTHDDPSSEPDQALSANQLSALSQGREVCSDGCCEF